jgi:hypothetical protein
LHLCEKDTAERYTDVSLQVSFKFNAVVVFTSNSLDLPPALLSRLSVFHIKQAGPDQKRRAALSVHKEINAELIRSKRTTMNAAALDALIDRDMDMRALSMSVRKASAVALRTGSKECVPVFSAEQQKAKSKKTIGFTTGGNP